jgi:hypothetical protein
MFSVSGPTGVGVTVAVAVDDGGSSPQETSRNEQAIKAAALRRGSVCIAGLYKAAWFF